MNNSLHFQRPNTSLQSVVTWSVIAAVAGLGCFVLPPYLMPGASENPAYGHPLIPWFATAFANLDFLSTMASLFLLGIVLGVAQPRYWLLLSCLTISLSFILHAINIIHDINLDPTSHNLWPFVVPIYIFIGLPALLGAFLGSWVRRVANSRAA